MSPASIRPSRRTTVFGFLAIAVALCALLIVGAYAQPASAQSGSLKASSGTFTGTDDAGNFQAALEDAVAQAAAAAGCCDIRISYEVLDTTGQHGGFVFLNDIAVRIFAEW